MADVTERRCPQALNRVLNIFGTGMVVVSAVTPAGGVYPLQCRGHRHVLETERVTPRKHIT